MVNEKLFLWCLVLEPEVIRTDSQEGNVHENYGKQGQTDLQGWARIHKDKLELGSGPHLFHTSNFDGRRDLQKKLAPLVTELNILMHLAQEMEEVQEKLL